MQSYVCLMLLKEIVSPVIKKSIYQVIWVCVYCTAAVIYVH